MTTAEPRLKGARFSSQNLQGILAQYARQIMDLLR